MKVTIIKTMKVVVGDKYEERDIASLETVNGRLLPVPVLRENERYERILDGTVIIIICTYQQVAIKVDSRPSDCRDRLQEEGQPYPRSSCSACGTLLRQDWKCPYKK